MSDEEVQVGKIKEWIPFIVLMATLLIWGVRLESQSATHLTKAESLEQRESLVFVLEGRLDHIADELAEIKADVAYLRGAKDALEHEN